MNKLYARVHVIYLPTWSGVAIYAKHAPRACDISSPDTTHDEDGMPSYDAFERHAHCSSNGMLILSRGWLWMSGWDFSPSAGGRRDHSIGVNPNHD